MTTSLRMSTCRRFFLVHFLCVLMFFTAGNSAALGTGPQSTSLSASHHGYQKLKVNSDLRYPTRGWATSRSSRHIHSRATSGESYSQVSGSTFKDADYDDNTVLVASIVDGTAEYGAIQDAVDPVPEDDTRRATIYITSGVYKEDRTPTTKPCITLQGEGHNGTVITWDENAAAAATLMRASAVVESDHFAARDISFKTSAGPPVRNEMNMQAAAFRISGGMAFVYRCNFFGYQDNLYDHEGRHHFFRCLIEGAEDFIFGVACSLFEMLVAGLVACNCLWRGGRTGQHHGSVSGFSFLSCIVTGTGRPNLGRARVQYSTVAYSYLEMDANSIPEGWYDWGLPERDRTAYFGSCRCTGRGANTTGRVYWARELMNEEAQPFLGIQFLDGPWYPPFLSLT